MVFPDRAYKVNLDIKPDETDRIKTEDEVKEEEDEDEDEEEDEEEDEDNIFMATSQVLDGTLVCDTIDEISITEACLDQLGE